MNESNFENETMKNNIIHFGPKVIIEDNIDGVENKNTFICFNCKKKVRFYISFLSVAKQKQCQNCKCPSVCDQWVKQLIL